jgi:hypothetical protein
MDWARLERYLDGMAAGDYLLVLRDLTETDPYFFGGGERERLRDALIERAAAADTAGLLAFAENADHFDRLYAVASACFPHAPQAVVEAIERLGNAAENPEEGVRHVEAVLGRLLSGENAVPALQALAAAGFVERGPLITDDPFDSGYLANLEPAMAQWAGQDRAAALAFAEQHPRLLPGALHAWAAEDVEGVLAWLDASPGRRALALGGPASRSIDDLFTAYAITHPVEAERYAGQVADLSHFHLAQANGMAHEPPEDAAAWLRSLPESDRASTASQLLGQFVSDTPAGAAELMGFLKVYPEAWQSINEKSTIQGMAAQHPEALAQQVVATASLPEPQRLETLRWIMDAWQERDPAATTSFLQSLPPSEMQGRLLMENTQLLTDETREAARAYALSLPDPAQRLGAGRFILKDITGNEPTPEQAKAFIELGAVREAPER